MDEARKLVQIGEPTPFVGPVIPGWVKEPRDLYDLIKENSVGTPAYTDAELVEVIFQCLAAQLDRSPIR